MLIKWSLGTIAVGSMLAGSSVSAADVTVAPTYIAPAAPAAVVVAPAPIEFYIGGGGLYSTGIGRTTNDPSIPPISNGAFARFAPFGYAGVRLPYRSVFFGLEGEYDFSRRSAESLSEFPGTPTTNGPIGAITSRYSARVSDRAALFSTVFLPFGGIELFGKLGVAYWRSEDTYSVVYNSPTAINLLITTATVAGRPVTSVTVVPTIAQDVLVGARRDVFAPVLGGGVQVPFGSFFVRLEGQVEFASTKTVTLPYNNVSTGVTSPGVIGTTTTPASVAASYIGSSDAKLLVSVGYKW